MSTTDTGPGSVRSYHCGHCGWRGGPCPGCAAREMTVVRIVRETLDEMLSESQARRDSPVWPTRVERAITDRLLASPDPVRGAARKVMKYWDSDAPMEQVMTELRIVLLEDEVP